MNRNQTKVIIPDAVAVEIETYRNEGVSNAAIISDVMDGDNKEMYVETLRSIPFDTLLSALVNGYVREKSEAERLAELLGEYQNVTIYTDLDDDRAFGVAEGIHIALGILGITIAGINDKQSEVSANV